MKHVGWADNWEEQLISLGVNCLYHVTDKDNFQSIGKERGLYSWSKLTEDGIDVPKPGGDAITHALDVRSDGRDNSVHLYASKPTEEELKLWSLSGRHGDMCVVKVSLRALRPGATWFWLGDPYDGGERIDNVNELVVRISADPSLLRTLSVDIRDSVHFYHISDIPEDVWTRVSEVHPTAIVFVIDQSYSMSRGTVVGDERYDYISELAAQTVNHQIENFLRRCVQEDGVVSHLYDIAVIGYGEKVTVGWNDSLSDQVFHSPVELLSHAEKRTGRYTWVAPKDDDINGRCDLAFRRVFELLEQWTKDYSYSYPPTVIHISDGNVQRDYQKDFLIYSEKLKRLQTVVGNVIVWNLSYFASPFSELVFLSGEEMQALTAFPSSLVMYEASSYLPEQFKEKAAAFHHQDPLLARKTMGLNVTMKTLLDILQLCVLPE